VAEFHFVEDYERHIAQLIANYPLDEAMSLAVGGGYEELGSIEADILRYAGLKDGLSLIDLGCGSGRLASVLGQTMMIQYTGIDIVQALLDYAKSKSPPNYRFLLHRALSIPAADNTCEFVASFSVFTHLLQAETYIYLQDIKRALKPGGKLVLSFLEIQCDSHWDSFESTVEAQREQGRAVLNMFIERSVMETWSNRLGYVMEVYIPGTEAPWDGKPLWQSVAILRKP